MHHPRSLPWYGLTFLLLAALFFRGAKAVRADADLNSVIPAPEFPADSRWLNTPRFLTLGDLRGKLVLLDFWTYACINCMHIIPDLRRLEEKYSKELVVLGIHSAKFTNESDSAQIENAIRRYGIRHPVLNDSSFQVWRSYGVRAWPTVVLISPTGKIIFTRSGEEVFGAFDPIIARAVDYFSKNGVLVLSAFDYAATRESSSALSFPGKISSDGQRLVITDSGNNRIVVTDLIGRVTAVIGSGAAGRTDGDFAAAKFKQPQGTAIRGDTIFIADTGNHLIRAADLKSKTVTTIAGTGEQGDVVKGSPLSSPLNSPWDVALAGEKLFIALAGAHQIGELDLGRNAVRIFAGTGEEAIIDGTLGHAAFAQPSGLFIAKDVLYVADSESSSIRKVDLKLENVETLIGEGLFDFGDVDGDLAKARLQHPLAVLAAAGRFYIADTLNSKIKLLDIPRASLSTFAGSGRHGKRDGGRLDAEFNEPSGLALVGSNLFVADTNTSAVRRIDIVSGEVMTLEIEGLPVLIPISNVSSQK